MENDGQKGEAPVVPEEPALEYTRIIVPLPDFPQGLGTPQDRSALETPAADRRWSDPRIVRRHPFEIYITGQSTAGGWPTIKCAWGTVCAPHTATGGSTITARTTAFTASANLKIWLEVEFDADGLVTACELKHDDVPADSGWSAYPEQFDNATITGNTWYHPIAWIEMLSDPPSESGEVVIWTDDAEWAVIRQLTNTHLRVTQECGTDTGKTLHWKLVPGPGAVA